MRRRDMVYKTRCNTLIFFGNGKVEVQGEGLLRNGKFDCAYLDTAISQLNKEGWILVGSVDRNHFNSPYGAMDLFFRQEFSEDG